MWPKVLAQLIELLPHMSRLVPIADRFLSNKQAEQEANTRAMQAMAEGLRGDLGQVTASHTGLYRQMNELDAKLTEVSADTRSMRVALDAANKKIARLEDEISLIAKLAMGSLVLLAIVLVILVVRK